MEKTIAFCAVVLILFIALTGCGNINGTDSPDESVMLSTPVENEILTIPPDTDLAQKEAERTKKINVTEIFKLLAPNTNVRVI